MLTNINSGYGRWWLEWRKYFPLRDHEGSTITGFFTKNRFLFFFRDSRSRNVAYSATAEGNVRRMVSQRIKNTEQTVQDEMTISTHIKENRKEGGTCLERFIVNALACKSSNCERGKMDVAEERYTHVSKTIRRELFKNRWRKNGRTFRSLITILVDVSN